MLELREAKPKEVAAVAKKAKPSVDRLLSNLYEQGELDRTAYRSRGWTGYIYRIKGE